MFRDAITLLPGWLALFERGRLERGVGLERALEAQREALLEL